ncbi:GGDEF domain-containing protein [Arenimonas composti]|uniref:diguanylate cyclase n=1 Tax=Arenimonas composti TR7-09 = DSM 18010 TaxID=1121013 RepID=A0A091BV86_9GAMM|nr:GGDEF domain-containing protein [Arenimonas composti]KFN48250.1 hypothetical protein P873_01450 [Arenimonas composti TR7-09 = DSM 18010]
MRKGAFARAWLAILGTSALLAAIAPWAAPAPPVTAPAFDLAAYRLLAASDREAGIAEGRRVLDAGLFDADPSGERQLLWYMGGAAIGMPDDVALGEVVLRLEGLSATGRDPLGGHYAGLLRGARLIDQGNTGDGLARILEAANALMREPERSERIVAAAELCRAYVAAERPSQAQPHCREHTRLVRESGDAVALGRAEYLEASVLSRLDLYEQAVPLWQRARRRFLEAGLPALAGRAAGSLAGDLVALRRFDEALTMARESSEAAEAAGNPISRLYAESAIASAQLGLGRTGAALATIDAAIAGMAAIDHPGLLASLLETRLQVLEASGADAAVLAGEQARLVALAAPEMDAEEHDLVTDLEQRYREREQALRIRELENANQAAALELERQRDHVARREAALEAQQRTTLYAIVAASALALALVVGALLLRSQRRLATSLHQQAYRDALTTLPNRRAMLEQAQALLAEAGAAGRGHALLMVDVDHFKAINDRGGHPFGDRVLAAVAGCLQVACADRASVGRFGGEEFLVLAPARGRDGAVALGEDLRACVAALRLQDGDRPEPVAVSVGIAVLDASTPSLAAWIAAADAALYRAKREGRDRVVLHAIAPTPL